MDSHRTDLSWTDVEELARTLAADVAGATGGVAFDRVLGIARGGLVPAVLVASLLDVKRVETTQIRFYDGASRAREPQLVGPEPAAAGPSGDPARTLVVDEILDSGGTMAFLHARLPHAVLGALVARNPGRPVAEYGSLQAFGLPTSNARVWTAGALATEAWILFPWSPREDRVGGGAST